MLLVLRDGIVPQFTRRLACDVADQTAVAQIAHGVIELAVALLALDDFDAGARRAAVVRFGRWPEGRGGLDRGRGSRHRFDRLGWSRWRCRRSPGRLRLTMRSRGSIAS